MGTHTKTETHEERFHRLLKEALEAGQKVQGFSPSRHNSLAMTSLEQAEMWAERDMKTKVERGLV